MELARRGDAEAARREGEAALESDPANPALLHMLGVLSCGAGALEEGAAYLGRAVGLNPADADSRLMLARALLDLGRPDDAEAACAAEVPPGPAANALLRLEGYIHQSQDRLAEAIDAYQRLLSRAPTDAEAWNNLGNAHRAAGELAPAIDALDQARRLRPDLAAIHYNLGTALAEAGRLDEALPALGEASRRDPENAAVALDIGRVLRVLGRNDEAVAVLSRVVSVAPDNFDAQLELGRVLAALRRFDEAERALTAAIDVQPGFVTAYQELGILLERGNRLDRLDTLLKRAGKEGVAAGDLAYLTALALRREDKAEEALAFARQAPETARQMRLIGKLADSLGDGAGAFAAFVEMNRLTAQDDPRASADAAKYRRHVQSLIETLTPEWHARWQTVEPDLGRPAPAFLVGFPRSGTTLLDTFLMGHPAIHVLEEEPILQRVEDAGGSLERLPAMSADEATRLRRLYFAEMDKRVPAGHSGLVIDKLPLNLLGAPLIHRIFPDARFIFAKRHPCDVTLSCFMQDFELNDAMANFLDLGATAALYDRALTFWTRARELLPLTVHGVAYENIVADAQSELRPLVDFLGLTWDDGVLDHQRTATARGLIITPSYDQVTQSIYADASGRWKSYREEMAPVLPLLLPWAERLGYST